MHVQYTATTRAAIRNYGINGCLDAYLMSKRNSATVKTVAAHFNLTTRQATAAINGGRELVGKGHPIYDEATKMQEKPVKVAVDLSVDVARRINGVLCIAIAMMERESKNENYSQAWRTLNARNANDLTALEAAIGFALTQVAEVAR